MHLIRPIVLDILAPILLLVAAGAVMRRKFKVDIPTLSKLNIYLFVPAFLFDVVSRSRLSWGAMGGVMVVTALNVAALGLVVWGIGRAMNVAPTTLAAVALAVMFYNSGNYGLPLAALAFPGHEAATVGAGATRDGGGMTAANGKDSAATVPDPAHDGAAIQAFVVLTMNLMTFTVGLAIAAWAGTGDWGAGLKTYLRLPMLPAVLAALAARWWLNGDPGRALPAAVAKPAEYLALGMVPVALVTLGAQLADNPRRPRWRPVSLIVLVRLVYGPAQMAILLYGFHRLGWRPLDLWGPGAWPAASLVLTAGVPTAINTLLLVLEVGGETELAADSVFWTTVISCVTIPAWLIVIRLMT